MIPADKLLPPVGILEKLAAVDSGAVRKIVSIVPEIARARQESESRELKISWKAATRKHFWKGLLQGVAAMAYTGQAIRPRPLFAAANLSSVEDVVYVGNDLRRAISRYCAEKAGLSSKDMAELKPLNISGGPSFA